MSYRTDSAFTKKQSDRIEGIFIDKSWSWELVHKGYFELRNSRGDFIVSVQRERVYSHIGNVGWVSENMLRITDGDIHKEIEEGDVEVLVSSIKDFVESVILRMSAIGIQLG